MSRDDMSQFGYWEQFGLLGGQSGIQPRVFTFGAAAYANVPTRTTNSTRALSERFIVFYLLPFGFVCSTCYAL
jgi:hypothetical protein